MEQITNNEINYNIEKYVIFTNDTLKIKTNNNIKIIYAKDINEILNYITNKKGKKYIIQQKYLKDKIIGLKNISTEQFLKGYEQALQINIKILKD